LFFVFRKNQNTPIFSTDVFINALEFKRFKVGL